MSSQVIIFLNERLMDITTTIVVNAKSAASVPGLLHKAAALIQQEFLRGELVAEDEDKISWNTKSLITITGDVAAEDNS